MLIVLLITSSVIFLLPLSYCGLLELWYRDKWHKTLTAKEQARRSSLSIRETEQHIVAEMFLDEYPCWKVGGYITL